MPLLEAGRPVADRFAVVADAAPLPDGPALIPLARLHADPPAGRNAELGVVVPSTTRPEDLAPLLDRVSLVAIEFPKFRDGRGFTIARTLRERYGFAGEIRAVGHLLPDQHSHAIRCGFSTVAVPDGAELGPWQAALAFFDVAYQPDAAGDEPVLSGLRRRRLLDGASRAAG
jgi:uncharacterized protein (DUF934 family)